MCTFPGTLGNCYGPPTAKYIFIRCHIQGLKKDRGTLYVSSITHIPILGLTRHEFSRKEVESFYAYTKSRVEMVCTYCLYWLTEYPSSMLTW